MCGRRFRCYYGAVLCLAMLFLPVVSTAGAGVETTQQLVQKGETYLQFHRYKAAVKAFSRAIRKDRTNVPAYLNRGVAWYNLGQYDLAISDFSRAITEDPGRLAAYNGRGMAWFASGQYKKAVADFEHVLKKDPENIQANNQLAWLLAVSPDARYRNGRRAVRLAKRAVAKEGGPHHLDTLAAAYAEAGRFKEAVLTQKNVIFLLMKKDQTRDLDTYVKRLTHYQKRRPWRAKVAARPAIQPEPGLQEPPETAPVAEQHPSAEPSAPKAVKKDTPKPATAGRQVSEAKPAFRKNAGKARALSPARGAQKNYPYTIQVSAYKDRRKALQVARHFRSKGDAAFTSPVSISGRIWNRVYMGFYPTLAKARHAVAKLQARRFRRTAIRRQPYALQVGVFKTARGLKNMQRIMLKQGYVAYRLRDMYTTADLRLLVGAFASRQQAAFFERALQKKGIDCHIVTR